MTTTNWRPCITCYRKRRYVRATRPLVTFSPIYRPVQSTSSSTARILFESTESSCGKLKSKAIIKIRPRLVICKSQLREMPFLIRKLRREYFLRARRSTFLYTEGLLLDSKLSAQSTKGRLIELPPWRKPVGRRNLLWKQAIQIVRRWLSNYGKLTSRIPSKRLRRAVRNLQFQFWRLTITFVSLKKDFWGCPTWWGAWNSSARTSEEICLIFGVLWWPLSIKNIIVFIKLFVSSETMKQQFTICLRAKQKDISLKVSIDDDC